MSGELARLLGALVSLVLLGLTYGFSPPLYGVTLHLLARGGSPRRPIVFLTIGMALSATVLLLAFRTFDPTTLAQALSGQVARLLVQAVVDFIAGAVLIIGGLVFAWFARRPRRPHVPAEVHVREQHPQAMIGVGFANTAIGVWPPVTMYVTGRVISGATPHLTLQVVGFAVFIAAVVGPYLAAGYVWRRMPGVATRVNRSYARLLKRDLRPLVTWGLLIAGGVFLVLGIVTAVTR
ncbi:hypothetical protein [Gryllotalpicola protaetiae]|uniref:hypothetical protein n=1 Tax=Gryllotalpicola protaetiae TaxID=2419771 RepID=UPI0013C50AA8|nr:hypothetical protein [Gryllotalpicola protaetiae]